MSSFVNWIGRSNLEQKLALRFFTSSQSSSLTQLTPLTESMANMIGIYAPFPQGHKVSFQPQGMSILVAHWVCDLLADDMSKIPLNNQKFIYQDEIKSTIWKVVSSPADKTLLRKFWLLILSYDAPEFEREAWVEFVSKNKYSDNQIRSAIYCALMNPYFLTDVR